jgi:hypothetical protein
LRLFSHKELSVFIQNERVFDDRFRLLTTTALENLENEAEAFQAFANYLREYLDDPTFVRHTIKWWEPVVGEIIKAAEACHNLFPGARFVGVGTSPAYIIHAIEQRWLQGATQTPLNGVECAPFSARFLERAGGNDATLRFALSPEEYAPEEYGAYRAHKGLFRQEMEKCNLNPSTIIDLFETKGIQTVFVDDWQGGGSLTTYIYAMFDWARDLGIDHQRFAEAVSCIGLTNEPLPPKIEIIDPANPGNRYTFDLQTVPRSLALQTRINGNCAFLTDRPVDQFSPTDFDKLPPEDERCAVVNAPEIAAIRKLIGDGIDAALRLRLQGDPGSRPGGHPPPGG